MWSSSDRIPETLLAAFIVACFCVFILSKHIFKGPGVTSHSCRLRGSQAFFYFTARFSEDRPVELKCDQQQSEGHLFRLIWFFCLIVQFIHVADEMVPLVSTAVPLSLRRQSASTSCLACANRAKHWHGGRSAVLFSAVSPLEFSVS